MQLAFKKMGSGPNLLILHGLYGNYDNWLTIGKKLSATFTVYLIDLRNHGRSPHAPEHTYNNLQNDVFEFCVDNNLDRVSILGHSMGGKTAILFALRHPEYITKLIIADISLRSYNRQNDPNPHILQHQNILNAYASIEVAKRTSRSEVDTEFAQYVNESEVRSFLLKNLVRDENGLFKWALNVAVLKASLENMMDGIETERTVSKTDELKFPTLIIRGEKSDYVTDQDFQNIKKIFPNAILNTVFDAGHWLHSEQQELFLKSLTYFLK